MFSLSLVALSGSTQGPWEALVEVNLIFSLYVVLLRVSSFSASLMLLSLPLRVTSVFGPGFEGDFGLWSVA